MRRSHLSRGRNRGSQSADGTPGDLSRVSDESVLVARMLLGDSNRSSHLV